MSSKLQIYKTYKISNAEVRNILPQFQSDGIQKQWVISTETVPEEVTDEQNNMLTIEFNYTAFKDFTQYVDSKNHAIGISLATRNDSVILIDPPKREARQHKNWFDVDLTDKSGTITTSVFADLGEILLGFSAPEAMKSSVQNKELLLEKIHKDLKSKIFIVQVKPAKTRISDTFQRHTLNYYFEDVTEQESNVNLVHQTSELGVVVPTENLAIPIQTAQKECTSSRVKVCLLKKFDATEIAKPSKEDASEDSESSKKKKGKANLMHKHH
ncbi:hypothetical protein ACH5RR_002515 [Cinchona calisaya]|uniref:Uncharacterized protein n=1 Tax=Cinchona calisaya TaxID=153742 RepID=A0ABD3B7S8_9GENT